MTGGNGIDRTDPRWLRIRATIRECSTEIDPDRQADAAYSMSLRRWNVEEELAAELHDTLEVERARSNGRDGKRKKAKAKG